MTTLEIKQAIIEALPKVSQIDCYKVGAFIHVDYHEVSPYLDHLAEIKLLKRNGFNQDGAQIYKLNN
jgi:hypothetical protein